MTRKVIYQGKIYEVWDVSSKGKLTLGERRKGYYGLFIVHYGVKAEKVKEKVMNLDTVILVTVNILIVLVLIVCWITGNPWLSLLYIIILLGQWLAYKIEDRVKEKKYHDR